jgi:hypothetical protein
LQTDQALAKANRYRRLTTRRTDINPRNRRTPARYRTFQVETAGAVVRSVHAWPLQNPLAHCRLSLHGSVSGRPWGVGVAVGLPVGVPVGVLVGVAVAVGVGVAVGCTHVPGHGGSSAAPPWPPPSQTRLLQPLGLLESQTRPRSQAGSGVRQHGPPEKPHIEPSACTLLPPAATTSTTSTASLMHAMAAVYGKTVA